MEKLLISACLLGNNVKYNGKNNKIDLSILNKIFEFVPICPEVDGGLSIPRKPSERVLNRVISIDGKDVTSNYELGKKIALNLAKKHHIKYALLKDKSPSCGNKLTYDGTFTSKLINQAGITAEALMQNGIMVFNENEINLLLESVKHYK